MYIIAICIICVLKIMYIIVDKIQLIYDFFFAICTFWMLIFCKKRYKACNQCLILPMCINNNTYWWWYDIDNI